MHNCEIGEPKQSEDGQDNRFENQHWVSPTTQRDVHTVTGIGNLHLKHLVFSILFLVFT